MIRVAARADVISARAGAALPPTRNDTEVCGVVYHRALSVYAVIFYSNAIRFVWKSKLFRNVWNIFELLDGIWFIWFMYVS